VPSKTGLSTKANVTPSEDPFPFGNPFIPQAVPRPSLKDIGRSKSATALTAHIASPLSTLTRRVSTSIAGIFSSSSTSTTYNISSKETESMLNLPESIRPDKSEIDFLRRTQREWSLKLEIKPKVDP
jgi:hypothetical protein